MPKISVIIPIYNVETYIKRCLHSIFSQTLDEIEYIFIDDGSNDNSIKIVEEILYFYPKRESYVKIIRHNKNLGIAAARTTGIKHATGEYLIHCDPDDYIENDMYATLYTIAKKNNSDIVICSYWLEQNLNKKIINNIKYTVPKDYIKFFYKRNHDIGFLWNKLVKRNIITSNSIFPYENINYAEDLNCIIRIYYYSKSITIIDKPLYHYCKRECSLSNQDLKKIYESHINSIKKICLFLSNSNKEYFETTIHYLNFYIKMKYKSFISTDKKDWFSYSKECHKDILKFNENSLKSRIILFICLKKFFLFNIFNKKFNLYI